MATDEAKFVTYHAGGKPGSRPILTGKDAKPTFNEIPLIDMTGIFSNSLEDRKRVAREVGKACREVGFFYAQNHQVPQAVITKVFQAMAKFFDQPHEEKMETHINKSKNFRGYEPLFETKLDPTTQGDLKESFTMGEATKDPEQHWSKVPSPSNAKENQWPSTNPSFRTDMYDYYTHVIAFAQKLLHVFALALEMPETYFDSMFTFPMAALRALHYPPQPTAENSNVGIGAHTDYCWFTLVCQDDVPALQVLNDNGIWVDAPPIPNTFVVNIGDFLMQTTNNVFQSTVHRVLNMTGERRYSIPFFFGPDDDVDIRVLTQFGEEGKQYEPINVKKYFTSRVHAARYKHPAAIAAREAAAEASA